ncbi:alternate signal-mediated exported protein [Enterococcus pallens]|nr:alternate signal-mediated exported protein [Enterococcus pallens]
MFRTFVRSKGLFACFSLVLSLLLVVGSTYAWITSDDERVNRSEATRKQLSARIDEDFNQVFHWAPGTTQTKAVRVKNDGETPAIVRLSFKEFFVGFEIDTTDNHRQDANILNGNANLTLHELDEQNDTLIDTKNTSTWAVGNVYSVDGTKHYVANASVQDHDYLYKAARTEPLSAFQLNFQAAKVFDDPDDTVGEENYWFYHDGFFYYSEVLQSKDDPLTPQTENLTVNLLESITLDAGYANQYKGALYKLVPEMDAHDITESILTDWGIAGSPVEDMYKDHLVFMSKSNQGGGG